MVQLLFHFINQYYLLSERVPNAIKIRYFAGSEHLNCNVHNVF